MNIFRVIKEAFDEWRGHRLFIHAHRYLDWKQHRYGEQHPELDRYVDTDDEQKWIVVHEIIVETERDKEQLLAAFEYIHDLMELDTDYMAVNYIAHLYECPNKIKVRSPSAN